MSNSVRRCPRCGFRGDGIPYFRRPSHVALLAGVGLFSYGIGGVIYWMVKRSHLVCANCGLGWEHALLGRPKDSPGDPMAMARMEPGTATTTSLPRMGLMRRVVGSIMALGSVVMVTSGLASLQLGVVMGGVFLGLAGGGAFLWGQKSLQARRQAVLSGLQQQVLFLASQRGGTLTVTEVAAELSTTMQAAERVLVAMDDGFRVRSEVTDEGIVLYEFPELQRLRPRLSGEGPGESAGALPLPPF